MNAQLNSASNESLNLEVLTGEEYQNQQADRLAKDVFDGEENAVKTGNLISSFVTSYEQHKRNQPLDQWLSSEFKKYPNIWENEADIETNATEVIASVQAANAARQSLDAHLKARKSRETWLGQQMEDGARLVGQVDVGRYAAHIDATLQQANSDMLGVITNRDGNISQALHLDGFLAEQHHADTFNIDAASKGSTYRAKVLNPAPGEAFGKNSMDIGIYDADGKLVRRYQSKYGKDADATTRLFEKGDYRGQRKLVPGEQVAQVDGATDTIEIDGVQSKPLTKAQAKSQQERAQQQEQAPQYEWNEVSRLQISKAIGQQALFSAGMTAALQGGRILGRRVWNTLTGKGIPPASEDLQEFFTSSLRSGANVGVQVAVSGAVVVAVKSGWVGAVLKGTPVGHLAHMVSGAMHSAKVLYKYAQGELTGAEALDEAGRTTTSTVGGLVAAGWGAGKGAAIGSLLGPVGTVVGGVIGGVVGGMAGSHIAEKVYEGGKKIVKTAVKVVKAVYETVRDTAKSVFRALNPFNWF